jgi:hypothetical protein
MLESMQTLIERLQADGETASSTLGEIVERVDLMREGIRLLLKLPIAAEERNGTTRHITLRYPADARLYLSPIATHSDSQRSQCCGRAGGCIPHDCFSRDASPGDTGSPDSERQVEHPSKGVLGKLRAGSASMLS